MSESEVEKQLKSFDKELDAFIAIKEKIERSFCKPKDNTSEERDFQLRMFDLQRKYDSLNSLLTVTIAVGFSYVIAVATILLTVPSFPQFVVTYLLELGVSAVVIVAFALGYLLYYHKTFSNKLATIRSQFIENDEFKKEG